MKKWFILLVLVLIASFLLSACTPSATPAPPTSAPATTQAAASKPAPSTTSPAPTPTTPTAANIPAKGGIMKFAMTNAPGSFGYPPKIGGPDNMFARPFFERLLFQDNKGVYQGELASSYNIAPDSKSITFKLRQGVQFSDGTPFNAAAVKWNFDSLIPPKANVLAGVTSVDAVDDYTVKLNMPAFNNLLLYSLAVDMRLCIASPTAIQNNGLDWAATHPVGTGPYILKDYQPKTSITYARNPNYWNKDLPYLEGMVGSAMPDAMTQTLALKSGDINILWSAAPASAAQLRDGGYPLKVVPGTLQSLGGDTANPSSIWADQKLREAVEYAIDKEAICAGPGMGLYQPMYQIAIAGTPDYNTSLTPRKYNVAKAKELLAAAGKPDGFDFTLFLNQSEWRDGLTAVQDYLSKVGIKMNINLITPTVFETNMRQGGKIDPNGTTSLIMEFRGNNLFMADSYLKTTSQYYGFMTKPKGIDDVINAAEAAKDEAARVQGMQQIGKIVYDSQPFIPLWAQPRIMVTDKIVQNHGFMINDDSMNCNVGFNTWLKK
jgi:peptide/nickel transport system substrate-binding protein